MARLLVAALAALALVLGLLLALRAGGAEPMGPRPADAAPVQPAQDGALREELSAALRRIEALELEVAALRAQPGPRAPAAPRTLESGGDPERGPRWYLEQYVRSFDGGGRGSEYFRLAVQAYALELVEPVGELLRRRGEAQALRAGLAGILGDPRLEADERAVTPLLATLAEDEPEPVVAAAVTSLRVVAAPRHLSALVARVFRVRHPAPREALLQLALDLSGERPNATLAALFRAAPDEAAELELIALMRTHDVESGVELLQLASWRERETRLAAARRTHELRGERTLALVDEWAARETDEEVRRALVGAKEALATTPAWHAEQATGPPDVADPTVDSREAWAPASADGGREWLELGYARAARVDELRVHEVCAAGGLTRVVLIDEAGGEHVVWEGVDPLARPDVLRLSIERTSYRARALRLELDTARRRGWDEIDAVQLLGPDGAQWATTARASSSYGGGGKSVSMPLEFFLGPR